MTTFRITCNLCGQSINTTEKAIIRDVDNETIVVTVVPCQQCQDGAYANGYAIGYEDSAKGKPKKSNTSLVKGEK